MRAGLPRVKRSGCAACILEKEEVRLPKPVRSVEELYAHALAIEREAAARYREFQDWFADRGEDVLAALCASIGRMEDEHFRMLVDESRGLTLPALADGEHAWLEAGSPEAGARELFYRVAEPRHLLEIALQGERNAKAFFERVARAAPDGRLRVAADGMAREEERHVLWMRNALDYHLATRVTDWDKLIAAGRGPGTFVGANPA